MPNPSATKQYVINQLPTSAGDITFSTFTEVVGIDTWTWTYQKVGKLYFGFWAKSGISGNSVAMIGAPQPGSFSPTALQLVNDSLDHLATLLGLTINTYYPTTTVPLGVDPIPGQLMFTASTSPDIKYWDTGTSAYLNGSNGGGTAQTYLAVGFLAN